MTTEVPQTHSQLCKCKLKLPYCITVFLDITLRKYLDSLGFKKKKKKKIRKKKVRSLGKIRLGANRRRLKLVFCLHALSWELQEHLTVGTHHHGDNLCQIEALH